MSLHRALTLCVGFACGALGVALLSAQATVSPSSVVVRVPSLPATCTTGQVVIVMTGSVALNVCTATDTWTAAGVGTGAPTDATYITKTANSSLSAEQALASLSTGLMKVTTSTGAITTASAGTDYVAPGAAMANLVLTGTLFAALGTPAAGTMIYCSDCTIANPCADSGTGAFAKRLASVWVCN